MKDIIIQGLIPIASTLITALASWALVEFRKFTAEKLKNEQVNAAMERITHTAQTVVDQLTQTVAINLKEAAENGKLTTAQARTLKQDAAKTVWKQLPVATKAVAELAVGSINTLISSKIEQAVLKQSVDKAIAASAKASVRPKYSFPGIDLSKMSTIRLADAMFPQTEKTEGSKS